MPDDILYEVLYTTNYITPQYSYTCCKREEFSRQQYYYAMKSMHTIIEAERAPSATKSTRPSTY